MKISLLTLLACLWGGSLLAQPKPAPNVLSPATKPATPATAPSTQPGQLIYNQYCLTCHQADGYGVPKLNPPLVGTDWILGDKTRLIKVLLNGLQNEDIDGESYDNAMPAHEFLTDTQLADVLTYIRSNFGNKAPAITADEVRQTRSMGK